MATEEELREVKKRYSARILQLPGVSGFGIQKDATGRFVLTVHLNTDDPSTVALIPQELEGHILKHVKSGPFERQ